MAIVSIQFALEKILDKLTGKVALITGGSSGIGLATAKRFVAEGAYVFITGRRPEELGKAKAAIGSNITTVQGDVSSATDLDRLYETIKKRKRAAGHCDRERRYCGIQIARGLFDRSLRLDF